MSQVLTRATLQFDGASRNNPGPAGAGAVLFNPAGDVMHEVCVYLGPDVTNNVAEYMGLIYGLEAALERGIYEIKVQGDSKLVLFHVFGSWQARADHLKELQARAKDLVKKFPKHTWEHIPRTQNEYADRLATRAIDDAISKFQIETGDGDYEAAGLPVRRTASELGRSTSTSPVPTHLDSRARDRDAKSPLAHMLAPQDSRSLSDTTNVGNVIIATSKPPVLPKDLSDLISQKHQQAKRRRLGQSLRSPTTPDMQPPREFDLPTMRIKPEPITPTHSAVTSIHTVPPAKVHDINQTENATSPNTTICKTPVSLSPPGPAAPTTKMAPEKMSPTSQDNSASSCIELVKQTPAISSSCKLAAVTEDLVESALSDFSDILDNDYIEDSQPLQQTKPIQPRDQQDHQDHTDHTGQAEHQAHQNSQEVQPRPQAREEDDQPLFEPTSVPPIGSEPHDSFGVTLPSSEHGEPVLSLQEPRDDSSETVIHSSPPNAMSTPLPVESTILAHDYTAQQEAPLPHRASDTEPAAPQTQEPHNVAPRTISPPYSQPPQQSQLPRHLYRSQESPNSVHVLPRDCSPITKGKLQSPAVCETSTQTDFNPCVGVQTELISTPSVRFCMFCGVHLLLPQQAFCHSCGQSLRVGAY